MIILIEFGFGYGVCCEMEGTSWEGLGIYSECKCLEFYAMGNQMADEIFHRILTPSIAHDLEDANGIENDQDPMRHEVGLVICGS